MENRGVLTVAGSSIECLSLLCPKTGANGLKAQELESVWVQAVKHVACVLERASKGEDLIHAGSWDSLGKEGVGWAMMGEEDIGVLSLSVVILFFSKRD